MTYFPQFCAMCSPSSKHRRSALVKSPISVPIVSHKISTSPSSSPSTNTTTCCWGKMATKSRSAARKLVKKYRRHPRKNVQVFKETATFFSLWSGLTKCKKSQVSSSLCCASHAMCISSRQSSGAAGVHPIYQHPAVITNQGKKSLRSSWSQDSFLLTTLTICQPVTDVFIFP